MGKNEWSKLCAILEEIEKRAVAEVEKSTGRIDRCHFRGVEVDGDMIAAYVEVTYCGCCPGETETVYFFEDSFKEKED